MKKMKVPMHPMHKRMADAMGVKADAFHKGKIVKKKGR